MINIPEESRNIRERYLQGEREGYVLDRYWNLVSLTISEILYKIVQNDIDNNLEELKREVKNLRTLITSRPIEEQMLFYHAEPLDVAVDLVGLNSDYLEEEPITEYIKLANKILEI